MRYDRRSGTSVEISKNFDQQVEEISLAPDGETVYFTAAEKGRQPIFKVSLQGGTPQKVVEPIFANNIQVTPDGNTLVFASSSLGAAPDVYRVNADGGGLKNLSNTNNQLIAKANLAKEEEVWWTGALGKKIHGYIVKPSNFDGSKKYPLLVLIHGGPQGAWNNAWSYRWNPQVFANAGYVVFAPNPRGSTGYGQQLVDEVSGDWGGRAYVDIMNGVADTIKRNSFIDKSRVGAAGASYGGYMINWIEGHNTDPRFQFKVLVCHDGVYNLTSMYGATEEVWFPEWEFKGTPWTNKLMYDRWSPHNFVKNFKTPILIIHGELDFRVPIGEGLQLYTAVQRMGIDSKLIIFPDEGHWVLKPQNSQFWYHNVLGWVDKYLK
jgi:dipeptidyl aminopeptidase/acylaminoacyl peptidase